LGFLLHCIVHRVTVYYATHLKA